ncbi:MAG: flagellar filament capping protein FliD [Terracidiphilus sp.]|jgi:flagellar hook-associated protein 2
MSSLSALNSLLGSSGATDLSQILEAATGASSPGIDVSSAVSASITAAEAPETNWENEQTTLQDQTSALTSLQTDATNLDNDMQSLNSLTGPLSAATVTSSNTSVVTGSAVAGSAAGNNVVVVNSLASTASFSSTAVTSATTDLPTGETITVTSPTGTPATYTTGSNGINTLTDLENAINTGGLGVTASIITDATGSRLAIISNTSGSAGSFTATVTGGGTAGTFGFVTGGSGTNSSITVNGIVIQSATNTVTGAIPGVTLNLVGTEPGTDISVDVAPDTSQASSAINQFVSDYNTLIGAVNSQYSDSGSGQGVLADDPTLENLQNTLLQALDYTASPASGNTSTTVPNLSALGVTMNTDGTLSLDNATLSSALQNNFSDVQNFFQGSALNGFANSMDQQLTNFTSPSDGAFTVDLQSISTENTTLQTDITNFQTNVIAPLKTQLTAEYSSAEIALQQLPAELKDVDAELGENNNSSSS